MVVPLTPFGSLRSLFRFRSIPPLRFYTDKDVHDVNQKLLSLTLWAAQSLYLLVHIYYSDISTEFLPTILQSSVFNKSVIFMKCNALLILIGYINNKFFHAVLFCIIFQ